MEHRIAHVITHLYNYLLIQSRNSRIGILEFLNGLNSLLKVSLRMCVCVCVCEQKRDIESLSRDLYFIV